MERVQFQQEQMLEELKDLVDKGIFTEKETKQVFKKRTTFETALVRRVAKKADFLRYAEYESGLEQLRKKRVDRLDLNRKERSISDHSLVRRQFQIYERALRKFKFDVHLWLQYIQLAKKEGATTLVGRITARALQLLPNTPAFYILAASHELENNSPSAARVLLQRGIRLNEESIDLWREYVKMEMTFIEILRRRWEVLGIQVEEDTKGKLKADSDMEGDELVAQAENQPSLSTRTALLKGSIVKTVITSALKAIPTFALAEELYSTIQHFPTADGVRSHLIEHLLSLVFDLFPEHPGAIRLVATRKIHAGINGVELVDAVQGANETFMSAISAASASHERLCDEYAAFLKAQCSSDGTNAAMRAYLMAGVKRLARKVQSPALFACHLDLLRTHSQDTSAMMKCGDEYLQTMRTSASVWLAYLEISNLLESPIETKRKWKEARDSVWADGIERIWMWGIKKSHGDSIAEQRMTIKTLLTETATKIQLRGIQRELLFKFATLLYDDVEGEEDEEERRRSLQQLARLYQPPKEFWSQVFELETSPPLVHDVYEQWRQLELGPATLALATRMMKNGDAQQAQERILMTRGMLDAEVLIEFDAAWKRIIDREEEE